MASVNKVILVGNLGAKPEIKYLQSGTAVCDMSIATNEKWTDKNQQKQERVEWHRIVVWGKQAEACTEYLDKGRQVYIEGRLQTRSWDDKETGEKKYMTEIVATQVVFLGKGDGSPNRRGAPEHSEEDAPPLRDAGGGSTEAPSSPTDDADIPF